LKEEGTIFLFNTCARPHSTSGILIIFLYLPSYILQVDPHLGGYDESDLASNELKIWATSTIEVLAYGEQGVLSSDAAQVNASIAFSKAWATALASEQVGRHGCRYHHLQLPSADAAVLFQAESLDMVTWRHLFGEKEMRR
jgi:hypothetical protein